MKLFEIISRPEFDVKIIKLPKGLTRAQAQAALDKKKLKDYRGMKYDATTGEATIV